MIFFIFLLSVKCDAAPGHYECGEHGRFEYCIDDNLGCVIGCHCFPGYYFDTESKICEPNTKLTQDYRRHMTLTGYNLLGSNSARLPPVVPAPPSPIEVPAIPNDPAQDGNDGDLSDWLYNQFFKTIESQVVNKTDDEPLKVGTRRSGAPMEPFVTRRYSSRKRKSKKRNLRKRKDDIESGEESSSSSESDSGDSRGLGSWERFEFDPRPGGPQDAPSEANKDGANRQIVMYSKKPKPPLPSFIFLPNMGTMFYPPIALSAPPVPMYPMVPIPPIHPGQPDCVENDPTTVAPSTPELTTRVTSTTTNATTTQTTTPTTTTTTATQKFLRNGNLLNRIYPKLRSTPQARQVFKPSPLPPPLAYPVKQYPKDPDYDTIFMGDNLFSEQAGPDFKYISDLIHRENNVTTSKSPTIINPKRYEQFVGMKPPLPHENRNRQPIMPGRLDSTRRRFDPRTNGEDDSYYSTLGKQIAKLIRGLDTTDVSGADIKIRPADDPKTAHPFFSESSYAARTYWERFVRSPLSLRLKNFTKYEDLITSNENLFDLENQVQEATSAPVLSWLELENVINTMGAIRKQIHDKALKNNNDKLSSASLNVSLLPRFSARKSIVTQKSEIKTNDNMLFATFQDVIGKLTKFNQDQKITNKGFLNKTEVEHSKIGRSNNLVHKPPRSIYLSTNILMPISTLKPIPVTLHIKGKKHANKRAFAKKIKNGQGKINYFNEIENKPHVAFRGETTFVKSQKYFFDRNINNQYPNWETNYN